MNGACICCPSGHHRDPGTPRPVDRWVPAPKPKQPEEKACVLCSADHMGEHETCDDCINAGKLL